MSRLLKNIINRHSTSNTYLSCCERFYCSKAVSTLCARNVQRDVIYNMIVLECKENCSAMTREIEEKMQTDELKYDQKVLFANKFALPMASKKLYKKLNKLLRASQESAKVSMKRGLKDVQRAIRKGEKGLIVLAGDVTPMDVMIHLPYVCEEESIPYCFVPSKKDLARAVGFQDSCLVVLVKEHPSNKEKYRECLEEVKNLETTPTLT